jgi:hypothetical protein
MTNGENKDEVERSNERRYTKESRKSRHRNKDNGYRKVGENG